MNSLLVFCFLFFLGTLNERKRKSVRVSGELAVVGWLWGQCVTSGCPGAPKREVSRGGGW